ncbi:MAG: hypothetical protein CMP95_02890 [Gammaproteobacteria bacterium]|nr:hypothetical protein [Gammaproteobacteria bacterium]|tara:strand:+ start:10519 stop:10947 length:429 start_codon:yes stop_codon:yes gene_type:complete
MADLVIVDTDVERAGNTGTYRAVQFGEAIAAGQAVYQSSVDQKFYLTDSNDSAKPSNTGQAAIAVSTGGVDQQGVVARGNAVIDLGPSVMTAGEIYVLSSANVGGIAPSGDLGAGAELTIVGYAQSDALLNLTLNATGITKA